MGDEVAIAGHFFQNDGAMSNLLLLQVTKEHSNMDKASLGNVEMGDDVTTREL